MMPFLETLGWTLMHALWQGLVIGLLVFISLRSSWGLTARNRHSIASLGLIAFFLTAIATFGLTFANPASQGLVTEPTNPTMAGPDTPGPGLMDAWRAPWMGPDLDGIDSGSSVADGSSNRSGIEPLLGSAWLMCVGVLSLRLIRQWSLVRRLRIDGICEPDARWIEMFDDLRRRLSIDDRIRMLASRTIDSPMVVGWLRPVVLVPTSAFTSLTPEQLQTILAHELLHISRRDHVLNMMQGVIEIALFFHPVTWWLSHQMRIERENSCDDATLDVTGSPRSLAEALLTLETLRSRNIPTNSALAATGGSLMHRISRLFRSNQNQSMPVGWRALSACTVMAVAGLSFATIAIGSPAHAQDRGARGGKSEKVQVERDVPDRKRGERRRGEISPPDDAASQTNPELERLRAGIESRVQAMGEDLRKQVAAGEIGEDEAKRRFEAGERRLWSSYRAAEMEHMEKRPRARGHQDDLERIKAGIEERLRAVGGELREQVAAGEMTEEQARGKYEAMEERMWSRYRDAEAKQTKGREQDEAANRELEELKAGIEERLRAMGRDIRRQVADGEISAEDGRAKYEAAEKRMWNRYRAAGERRMKGRKQDQAGNRELEELKAGIEERLRAMGGELREQVAAGEMTKDQAREKYEAMEERMWSRYRAAEEKKMKGRKQDEAGNRELEELKARIEVQIKANADELDAMVEDGKISEADAKARYEMLERRLWMRYRAAEEGGTRKDAEEHRRIDLEELKAGIEERLRAMGSDIRQQVADGEMSAEDGRAKYEAAEKRMWTRYRSAEEKMMNGRKEAEDGNRELEELKTDIEERLRAMGRDIRQQVADGAMSADEGRAKYEAAEKRMWTRYRAAGEKQLKEKGRDKVDSNRKSARRISRKDFDAAVERMTGMVQRGEITRKDMQTRLEQMKRMMKD